jgi:bifunctional UDP-N-acetylglucosamine pyrophosphorylase/glucosamine-1-phosphate N-acetyltransferase
MDAIILAAGKGTRLRPYTNNIPKPLLPVQGRPILDWILGALPPVQRVVVVVNYLAEQIEAYLKTQKHVANWVTVRQAEPRGTGDALMACRGKTTSEKVMVLNGDDLIGRADLAKLASVPMGILVHAVGTPEAFGIVFSKPDGTLEHIIEKPQGLPAPQMANIGGYVFPKSVFDLKLTLSPRNEYEITEAVAKLAENGPFHVVESKYWLPIGDVEQWCWSQLKDVNPVQ